MSKTLIAIMMVILALGLVAATTITQNYIRVGPNFLGADGIRLGNQTVRPTIFFNTSYTNVTMAVQNYTTLGVNSGSLVITRGNDTPFIYTGYQPTLSVTSEGFSGVATQFYASTGNIDSLTELMSFWGGVGDRGDNANGMIAGGYGASGVFAYNAFQGQNARNYPLVNAVAGISETSGASFLTIDELNGAQFQANDGLGADSSFDLTNGIHILNTGANSGTNGAGKENNGLLIDAITDGGINFAIQTKGGPVRFAGTLNVTGRTIIGGAANKVNISATGDILLEGTATMFDDLQFPISTGKNVGGSAPTWESLTTNVYAYSFTSGNYLDLQAGEMPHWWLEGGKGDVHTHLIIKTLQNSGASRYANFTAYIAVSNSTGIVSEVKPISAVLTIPNGAPALTAYYLDLGDLALTGSQVGGQITMRIKRTAQITGTEYAYNIFVSQVGIHMEKNTMGSRTETAK